MNGQNTRAFNGQVDLDLRVAVTGHLWIPEDDPAIVNAVQSAFNYLRLHSRNTSTAHTHVGLTVVSSLAEGADRVVARVGLELDVPLDVVLPLPDKDYRQDFADAHSKAAYDRLCRAATSISVLSGTDPTERSDAYAAAGRQLLARADVLLAIWDGEPARGGGGTAQVVGWARELNVPLYWIEVSRDGERLTVSVAETPTDPGALSVEAFQKLDWFNSRKLHASKDAEPASGYPRRGTFAEYAAACFVRADTLAGRMQLRFRAVSRALYVLSVFAVGVVAAQVIFARTRPEIAWVEFVTLVAIIVVLARARRAQYLERWLSIRYLAERIRSLAFLAELASDKTVHPVNLDAPLDNPMEEWIKRALNELWLRSPDPVQEKEPTDSMRRRIVEEWLQPQIKYQADTHKLARRYQVTFSAVTLSLFTLSVVTAFVHSTGWLHSEHHPDYLGFLSLIVPAAAAALSGYAAQRDYARRAIRSATMETRLRAAETHLSSVNGMPELRQAALSIDLILQGEAADWYTAVRVREVDIA